MEEEMYNILYEWREEYHAMLELARDRYIRGSMRSVSPVAQAYSVHLSQNNEEVAVYVIPEGSSVPETASDLEVGYVEPIQTGYRRVHRPNRHPFRSIRHR